MALRSLSRWLGPANEYGPSKLFWRPAALKGMPAYEESRALAAKLAPLNRRQQMLLRRAHSRPWDFTSQASIQIALIEAAIEPLFPKLPCEISETLRRIDRLADRYVLFIPHDVVVPPEAQKVIEKLFWYRVDSGNVRVFLAYKLTEHHHIDVGITGSGKSLRAEHAYLHCRPFGGGRWVFVHRKPEEWRPLIPALREQGVCPAMPRELKINPVAVVGGDPRKCLESFVQTFIADTDLPPFSRDVLAQVCDKTYRGFGLYSNPNARVQPTIRDLQRTLDKSDSKTVPAVVRNTLRTRLEELRRICGDYSISWPIEELGKKTIIFPLADSNSRSARIKTERLQFQLYATREGRVTDTHTLVIHEEGRHVFAGRSNSDLAEGITTYRAEGLAIYVLAQSMRDLHPQLLENTGVLSLGPTGHPNTTNQMVAAMGLRQGHIECLRERPVGTCIDLR